MLSNNLFFRLCTRALTLRMRFAPAVADAFKSTRVAAVIVIGYKSHFVVGVLAIFLKGGGRLRTPTDSAWNAGLIAAA